MLRRPLVLLLAVPIVLLGAAPVEAYKLGGRSWPGTVITYHSALTRDQPAVRDAVAAWNASGARIRFVAASKTKAKLRIVYDKGREPASGDATLGYFRPHTTTVKRLDGAMVTGVPCGFRVPGSGRVTCKRAKVRPLVRIGPLTADQRDDPFWELELRRTITHELGHVLGLDHAKRTCAVMSYEREATCPAPQPWQLRCRLLEADDVRGAVKRYRGRLGPLAPEFCDQSPEPVPPNDLGALFDPDQGAVTVTFRVPDAESGSAVRTLVGLHPGTCPAASGPADQEDDSLVGAGGTVTRSVRARAPGRYCVAVRLTDRYDRTSAAATTIVDVPAPAPAPEVPPPFDPEIQPVFDPETLPAE